LRGFSHPVCRDAVEHIRRIRHPVSKNQQNGTRIVNLFPQSEAEAFNAVS
jgi:hypothetical protein